MNKVKDIILWGIAIVFVIGMVLNNRSCSKPFEGESDTTRVTIIDTITYFKPIPKDSIVIRYITEILPIVSYDTIKIYDSIRVEIPITQKVYKDSSYTAFVSGFKLNLDSIFIYPQKEVQTITKKTKPKRWGVGLQVGYGVSFTPSPMFSPYIGVGVSYNLFNF